MMMMPGLCYHGRYGALHQAGTTNIQIGQERRVGLVVAFFKGEWSKGRVIDRNGE